MAFIPIFLFGFGIGLMGLLSTVSNKPEPIEPTKPTPEQKLADAIAEYMKSRNRDHSDKE